MDSFVTTVFVIGLFVVILAEGVLIYFILERERLEKEKLLDELAKANTAIAAKSANEYMLMRSMDNVPVEKKKNEPQGVDVSELSDEEYDKMLKESMKVG